MPDLDLSNNYDGVSPSQVRVETLQVGKKRVTLSYIEGRKEKKRYKSARGNRLRAEGSYTMICQAYGGEVTSISISLTGQFTPQRVGQWGSINRSSFYLCARIVDAQAMPASPVAPSV